MNTGQLIDALSADVPPVARAPLGRIMCAVMALAAVVAVCVMLATVGPRHHLEQAPAGLLLLKLLFPTTMAAIGGFVLFNAMRPGQDVGRWSPYLWMPMVFVGVAGMFALVIQPVSQWDDMVLGTNWAMCLLCIPLFAILPFALLIVALRRGAPTELARTGAMAGLVAGALGAAAYSLHCPDDSVPFVAVWYAGLILLCAAAGRWLGPQLLRW